MHPGSDEGQQHTGPYQQEHSQQVEGSDYSPIWCSLDHIWNTASSFVPPSLKDMNKLERVQWKATKMVGAGVLALGGVVKGVGVAPLREVMALEDLRAACPYLREDQAPH